MIVDAEAKNSQQPDYFRILKAKFVLYDTGLSNGKSLEN